MLLYLSWFFASVLIFIFTLKTKRKTQNLWMAIYLFCLAIFIGFGDMLGGYDRYIYAELFDRMADYKNEGGTPFLSPSFMFYGSEFGYGSLCAVITYFTGNRYIFIFIVTIIIYLLLIQSLRQYTTNAPFAVILFLGLWMFFTFTYLRQVLGCTIVWLSVRYIIKRDLIKFLLVWFIGFSFHNSALIFLPMYFVPIKKYSEKSILIVMIIALIIGLTSIPQNLFSAYEDIAGERVSAKAGYDEDAGFRIAYLVEAVFFLFIILYNYKKIPQKALSVVMLNISLVFCAILLIFIKSENGGRLGWLYMIGIICTLTNICIRKRKIHLHGVFLIVISLLLFVRVYTSWQKYLNLYPYKTFLTNGYREGDYSWENYEYDHEYDEDKFYRK